MIVGFKRMLQIKKMIEVGTNIHSKVTISSECNEQTGKTLQVLLLP